MKRLICLFFLLLLNPAYGSGKPKKPASAVKHVSAPSTDQLSLDLEARAGIRVSEQKNLYDSNEKQSTMVHIRTQNNKGVKTIVEGLSDDLDLWKMRKYMMRILGTRCYLRKDENDEGIMVFFGDVRAKIKEFLVKHNICDAKLIQLHGA